MSIGPIGGLAAASAAISRLASRSATDAPGAPDHDGDGDNAGPGRQQRRRRPVRAP